MMTWLRFAVEVQTTDERPATPARIEREVLRALEARFSAVTVERDRGVMVVYMPGDAMPLIAPCEAGPR